MRNKNNISDSLQKSWIFKPADDLALTEWPDVTWCKNEVIWASAREGRSVVISRHRSDEAEVRTAVNVLELARVVVVELSQGVVDLDIVRSVGRVAKDFVVVTCREICDQFDCSWNRIFHIKMVFKNAVAVTKQTIPTVHGIMSMYPNVTRND